MTYFHFIVTTIQNKKIPKSLIISLDQTPSKYVPGWNKTLAPNGVKNVSIAGSTDKRAIIIVIIIIIIIIIIINPLFFVDTATFSITMDG